MGYQQVDSLEALRRRRARAGASETTSGIFFQSILDCVKARRGQPQVEALLEEMGTRRWLGLMRYPVRDYLLLLEKGLLLIGGEAEFNDNLIQLGVDASRVFRESPVGQLFERTNAGAVHRVMAGVRLAYATTSSYGERSYVRLKDQEGLLRVKGDWVGPAGALGAILGGVPLLAGSTLSASVEAIEDDGASYNIRVVW